MHKRRAVHGIRSTKEVTGIDTSHRDVIGAWRQLHDESGVWHPARNAQPQVVLIMPAPAHARERRNHPVSEVAGHASK